MISIERERCARAALKEIESVDLSELLAFSKTSPGDLQLREPAGFF